MYLHILRSHVTHDVLVEELQNQRNAVGKNQMLGHEFELINVIQLEVLQQ